MTEKIRKSMRLIGLDSSLVELDITVRVGKNFDERCSACVASISSLVDTLKKLDGARFVYRSDRILAGKGNFIYVEKAIKNYPEFFMQLLSDNCAAQIEMGHVSYITVGHPGILPVEKSF